MGHTSAQGAGQSYARADSRNAAAASRSDRGLFQEAGPEPDKSTVNDVSPNAIGLWLPSGKPQPVLLLAMGFPCRSSALSAYWQYAPLSPSSGSRSSSVPWPARSKKATLSASP